MKQRINNLREKAGRHKTLIQNFSYLSALQVVNMLLPLITYPYLIRVLGKETYGLVVFAQAIVGYLVILVGFGFNISATKEISIHRDNRQKLSEIVSSVLLIKGILFILSMFILSILVFFIPQAKEYKALFFLTMWMCLYDVIFPIWYFQGIEQMKYITYITLISRLTFLALIFVLIHTPEDYLFIPIINGIGALVAGLISLVIVFRKHHINFNIQPYNGLKHYFLESVPIFVSNVSTTIYLTTNKVILGVFLGMKEVAYYDLAEKLSSVLKTPILIIGQTIYPKIANTRNKAFIRKSFFYTLSLSTLILISGILFSRSLVKVIGGVEMIPSISIFQILLTNIIPVTISLFFANLVLISWGYNKEYLRLRLLTNGLYVLIIFSLYISRNINLYTLSFSSVLIEIFAGLLSINYSKRKKINFLTGFR